MDDSHSQAVKSTDAIQKGNYLHQCWQNTTSLGEYKRMAVFNQNHALKNKLCLQTVTFQEILKSVKKKKKVEQCGFH